MRNISTLTLLLLFFSAKSQDGTLDNSFGTSGLVSYSVPPTGAEVSPENQKLVVLPDGKILQCFTYKNGTSFDFGLVRYTSAGALDPTFDGDGILLIDFGGEDHATSLIVQPSDQKIIVAGYSTSGATTVFAIARLSASGVLDASFSGDGKQTTTIGTTAVAYSVALQPDGKIIQAGYTLSGSAIDFAVVRYDNTTGNLDNTFDTDGIVTTDISSGRDDVAYNAVVQGDGKIILAGYHNDGTRKVFAFVRYNSTDGSLDNTFSGDGKQTVAIGSSTADAEAYSVTLQPDGKIIAGGYFNNGTNNDFALVRLSDTGTPDNTFDTDGIATTDLGGFNDAIYSVGVQADGKILVGGTSFNGLNNDFALARYISSGTLDVSGASPFNGGVGSKIIDFGGDDFGYSIASQNTNIIIGGVSGTSVALARLLNSSKIVPVKLTSFTASKRTNVVELNWTTVNEQNMLAYEIERSADGIQFTTLGSVGATGRISSAYSFIDNSPLASVNFYRLKMINTDLSFSYSRIVTVRFSSGNITFEAYPNPVKNNLNIHFTLPKGEVRIQLFDAQGRMVKQLQLQSSGSAIFTTVDMSNFQKGIYFIKVNNERLKIIKD